MAFFVGFDPQLHGVNSKSRVLLRINLYLYFRVFPAEMNAEIVTYNKYRRPWSWVRSPTLLNVDTHRVLYCPVTFAQTTNTVAQSVERTTLTARSFSFFLFSFRVSSYTPRWQILGLIGQGGTKLRARTWLSRHEGDFLFGVHERRECR